LNGDAGETPALGTILGDIMDFWMKYLYFGILKMGHKTSEFWLPKKSINTYMDPTFRKQDQPPKGYMSLKEFLDKKNEKPR